MPSTTRYILYARKSSESEDRQIQSIADQERELRALAKRLGLRIVEELSESRSAKAPHDRPLFSLMLKKIRAGEADGILCWHLNRLSRNPVESGELSWMLQRGELKSLRTIDREYLPSDNVLLFAVESGAANQYILELKRGIERGLDGKAKRGVYPYRAKPGYQVDRVSREHIPDPQRFPLLRRAWELVLSGGYTIQEAMREFENWGYRTPKTRKAGDKPITRSAFYELFSDRFYAGYFMWKGELIKGTHQPMVTLEEFQRVQRILGHGLKTQPKHHVFPYTGLATCGTCGGTITAEVHTKHYRETNRSVTYTYYHCATPNCRPKTSISGEVLETQLVDFLASCRLSPRFVDWALGALERDVMGRTDTEAAILRQREEASVGLEAKLKRLNDLYLDGDYSREEFGVLKERYSTELNRLRLETDAVETETERVNRIARNVLTFSRDAYERFTVGDVHDKREIAKLFGVTFVLTNGKLEFEPDPRLNVVRLFEPFDPPSQQVGDDESGPDNPLWYRLLEAVRTAAKESDRDFPALSTPDLAA